MTWYPVGPDFVFAPRNPGYRRLSRGNELGRQGLANCIAIDPTNPSIIYVVDRPSNGGAAVFRSSDGGSSWTCISDTLLRQTDPRVDPIWIAVNPMHPDTLYLGTFEDAGLYISPDGGESWGHKKPVTGRLHELVVDARHASDLQQTRLLVATESGVYFSDDSGDTWDARVTGDAYSLTAHTPSTGTAHFYAGVKSKGLHYTTDPTATWTNLNDQAIGLPAFVPGDGVNQEDNFHHILVAVCRADPNRVYAWIAKPKGPKNDRPYVTEGLYTTSSPTTAWTKVQPPTTTLQAGVTKHDKEQACTPVSMTGIGQGIVLTVGDGAQAENVGVTSVTSTTFTAVFGKDHAAGATVKVNQPDPAQGWYNYVLAIAPNSPGNGKDDILFFGRIEVFRSIDGGVTWDMEPWDYAAHRGNGFHADQHSFAFVDGGPGTIPEVYLGSDGGISKSTAYCDPKFDFATLITDHNEGSVVADTGLHQNLDHGKQCSALNQYTSHSKMSALSYIGCQDTGVNGGVKTLGWRGLADADGGAIAIAPGTDGVVVWGNLGSPFYMRMWNDTGDFRPTRREVTLGSSSGPFVKTTSNYEIDASDRCITGMYVFSPDTTLTADVAADAVEQTVVPASMSEIRTGTVLTVGEGTASEYVTVTAMTPTDFTAVFTKNHASGSKVLVNRSFVARVDDQAIATPISSDFTPIAYRGHRQVWMIVMPDPSNPDVVVCATGPERERFDKVWFTTTATTATGATDWMEAAGHKPPNANVHAIAITPGHDVYLLLREPVVATGPSGAPIPTPLFKLVEADWVPQACIDNPAVAHRLVYGKLVAHPKRDDILFACHGGSVYQLVHAVGQWQWIDISEGMPGGWVYDLWTGFTSLDEKEHHVTLRAGIPTRGIWEHDPAVGIDVPDTYVYMRDHLLDQGLLETSEDGLVNPFDPKRWVWHFLSADIKVDVQEPAADGRPAHFQTDPEGGSPPFDHVLFDQIRDHSRSVRPGAPAWAHAQVHNRSRGATHNVNVWAIYCNASAGVPSLAKSAKHADAFDFWTQFTSTGGIVPNLPEDSPWRSLGKPVTVGDLDALHPQVASWKFTTPTLSTGDPGHYCVVVFVHGGSCLISENGTNVDAIVRTNRQIAQKNLHVGATLGGSSGGAGQATGTGASAMVEYVEFHNPGPEPRVADLCFDVGHLPPEVSVKLQLTPLETRRPLEESIFGVARTRPARPDEVVRRGGWSRLPWRLRSILCLVQNLLCGWLNRLLEQFDRGPLACDCTLPYEVRTASDDVHEVEPGSDVVVRDVIIGANDAVAAFVRVGYEGGLPDGSRHHFEVRQVVDGVTIGGSAYEVPIAGMPEFPPPSGFPFDMEGSDRIEWDRIEHESEQDKYLPPWAVGIAHDREAETEK